VDIGCRSHHRHGWKGKQRFQQRNNRKNEAISGVFYESKNNASFTTMNVAPVFVPAKQKKKKEFGLDSVRDSDDNKSNINSLPSFVAAKSSDSDNSQVQTTSRRKRSS
jgi:hypothetical protein